MLDCFEIITTTGIVLWSRSNVPVGPNVVNSLINDVFIEEKVRPSQSPSQSQSQSPSPSQLGDALPQTKPTYRYEKYTLKWTLVKDIGLIFVVRHTRGGSD